MIFRKYGSGSPSTRRHASQARASAGLQQVLGERPVAAQQVSGAQQSRRTCRHELREPAWRVDHPGLLLLGYPNYCSGWA
jgi:hypothetical protein